MRELSFPSLLLSAVVLLTACGDSGQDEVKAWMQSERDSVKPNVQPIADPGKFVALAYDAEQSLDPFDGNRLTRVLKTDDVGTVNSALIEPELNRRKQPLESYPLDSMTMVGSLDKGGQLVALIKVDGLLYQVNSGAYLGQNYGRVGKVTETEVTLREIVQDAAGEWIERVATLNLQEGSK